MPVLPDVGNLLKDLVWNVLIEQALKRVFEAVPWLGWGPIGAVIRVVVGLVADELFDGMRTVFNMQKILFVNLQHQHAFEDASLKLQLIARDKGIESIEYKEARIENRKRLSAFTQFAPRRERLLNHAP